MPDAAPLTVTATGLLRGQELSGPASVALRGETVELVTRAARFPIPLAAIAGAKALESGAIELALSDGDAVTLFAGINGAGALRTMADELLVRACTMPELTRGLRALGSHRAGTGNEHDRFFKPLLEARRGAARATRADGVRLAFDAASIRAAFVRRLREMAHERQPHDPPERRALEAEAVDAAAPLFLAIADLEDAQKALDAAAELERFARWRAWTQALQHVFERADEAWMDVRAIFGRAPVRVAAWRRIFRRRDEADA